MFGTVDSGEAIDESIEVTGAVVSTPLIDGGNGATRTHTFFFPSRPHTCVFFPFRRTAPNFVQLTAFAFDFTDVNHTVPVGVDPHTCVTFANFFVCPAGLHGVPTTA
jgi:hypothetical protein